MVHGLMRGVAEVEDRKASVSQDEARGVERELDATAGVGPAMVGGGNHVAHHCARLLRPAVAPKSDDSAHNLSGRLFAVWAGARKEIHCTLKVFSSARPIHFVLDPTPSVLAELFG